MKELVMCAGMAAVALACNVYDPNNPALTYLCAGEKCDTDGDSSQQCQSGCCHDGACNDDGQCAKHQLILSVVSIVCIMIAGVGLYFLYWYLRCRGKPNGLAPPADANAETVNTSSPFLLESDISSHLMQSLLNHNILQSGTLQIDYTLLYQCFDVLDVLGFVTRKSDSKCN